MALQLTNRKKLTDVLGSRIPGLGVSLGEIGAQIPNAVGQVARGAAGAGDALLGGVNHLANVISYPINTAQYNQMANRGQINEQQQSQLINEAGQRAGFNIQDRGPTVLRKSAGAVAGPAATILSMGVAPAFQGLKLGQQVARGAAAGAGFGGTFGGINALQQDEFTPQSVAGNVAGGAAAGALLGGAAPIAGKILKPAINRAKVTLRDERGSIGGSIGSHSAGSPTTEQIAAYKSADDFIKNHPDLVQFLGPQEMTSMYSQAKTAAKVKIVGRQAELEKLWTAGRNEEALKVAQSIPKSSPYREQMLNIAKSKLSTTRTVYHGEGAPRLTEPGGNMAGQGFYVTPDKTAAGQFGKQISTSQLNLKNSEVLTVKSQDELKKLYMDATRANMDVPLEQAVPKFATSKGYKAIEISPEVDPLGGINVIDRSVLKSDKGGLLQTLKSESGQLGLNESVGGKPSVKLAQPVKKVEPKPLVQRGFAKNLESTPDSVANLVAKNIPGYKPITNKGTLQKVSREIGNDPAAAHARLVTKGQLTSANDVATGNVLLHKYIEDGNIEDAMVIGQKLGVDGTKLGQAVQAYSMWKKTTPEGILREATKQAFKTGQEVDPAVAKDLIDRANKIAEMPEGFEKAKATREMLGEAEKLGRTWKDTLTEVFNMPRALMATMDFSAPLRQGVVLGSRYPKQFGKAFGEMFKYWAKPAYFEQAMYDITQKPTYGLMKSHKLAVDGATQLTGTEEQFLTSMLEGKLAKKAGVGQVIAASNRAYSGFLTKLRADVFDKTYKDFTDAGVKLSAHELDSLTKFINSASGRGQGTVTDQLSRLQVLFSARLWKSRLDNLNPLYYARLDPVARKLAVQSTASFAAVTGALLGLAKLSGMEVETDPRSADFAKIKVDNTRYDILSGHQQNIRLIAQLATGKKINSVTGEEQTLGADRGFGKPSRLDLLYQFLENKENPIIGFATKVLRGTDQVGQPINVASEAGKLAIPLVAQGTYDTIKDTGSVVKGVAMNIPNLFGVGTQTYGASPTKDKNKTDSGATQQDDGTYTATIDGKDKNFKTRADAELAIAKDEFSRGNSKSKVVGDTYLYKNKAGDVKSKPKVLYDWEQADAKLNLSLDRAYDSKNLNQWLTLAQQKVDALEKKKELYDPETEADEIDKITLAQENLVQKAEGYVAKGLPGSKTGKKKAALSSSRAYAVSTRASGKARRPTVTVSTTNAPRVASRNTARPAVKLARSLV